MPKSLSAVFVVAICLAGYLFLSNFPATKYRIQRRSGYHVFFGSAGIGILIFFVAVFVYWIGTLIANFSSFNLSFANWVLNDVLKCDAEYTTVALLDIVTVSIILGRLVPKLMYGFSEEKMMNALEYEITTDPETPEFTQLFFKSMELGKPILFTMSDRKVFIGYVYEVHAGDFNDILILPYYSGYRDKNTLELVLVTPYKQVIEALQKEYSDQKECSESIGDDEEILDNVKFGSFLISLPIREINHAHLHDFRYYKRFKAKERHFQTQLQHDNLMVNFKY